MFFGRHVFCIHGVRAVVKTNKDKGENILRMSVPLFQQMGKQGCSVKNKKFNFGRARYFRKAIPQLDNRKSRFKEFNLNEWLTRRHR